MDEDDAFFVSADEIPQRPATQPRTNHPRFRLRDLENNWEERQRRRRLARNENAVNANLRLTDRGVTKGG